MLTTPKSDPQHIDFGAAVEHLRLLDPIAPGFVFLATDDSGQKRPAQTRYGSIHDPEMRAWMDGMQHAGFAIHVTVQEMLGHDRKAENLKRIRVVFAEMDQPQAAPWPVDPSFSVNTSPDKWHHYWLVQNMDPLTFRGIMQRMVDSYGSDQGVIDYSRVLRLAGTLHLKGAPYRVGLVLWTGEHYPAQNLVSAFPPVVRAPRVPRVDVGGPILDMQLRQVDEALGLLAQHPDWAVRDVWLQAGMALNSLTEGGERGLQMWIKHSWPGHEGECIKAWGTMTPDKGTTYRTIFALAKPAGWRGSSLDASMPPLAPMPGMAPFLAPAAPPPGAYPGDPAAAARAVAAASWAPQTYVSPAPVPVTGFNGLHTVDDINQMVLAEKRQLVEGLLPAGCFLLIGKPKKGKSWMVLDIALSVATGGQFLGKRCEQGKVLYFALEDNLNRIQDRARQLMARNFITSARALQIATMEAGVEGMDQGFFQRVRATLDADPSYRLIVVDTLSCVRPAKVRDQGLYSYDRAAIDPFTRLCADFPGLTVLIVHHARKADSLDPQDMSSGTTGLTGACDGFYVLADDHENHCMVLYSHGRDAPPVELALKLNIPKWECIGTPEEAGLGETQKRVVDAMKANVYPMRSSDIADAIGESRQNTSNKLTALLKRKIVTKTDKGLYMLVAGGEVMDC